MNNFDEYIATMRQLMLEIEECCPTLSNEFYLGGTMPISCDHLRHVVSLDIDLHTKEALAGTSTAASLIKKRFGRRLSWFEADPEFGIYRGTIRANTPGKEELNVSIDLLSNVEDAPPLQKTSFCSTPHLTLDAYLESKLVCLEARAEVKDLLHLYCLRRTDSVWRRKVDIGLNTVDPLIVLSNLQTAFSEMDDVHASRPPNFSGLAPFQVEEFRNWLTIIQERTISNVANELQPNLDQTRGTRGENSRSPIQGFASGGTEISPQPGEGGGSFPARAPEQGDIGDGRDR